MSVWRASLHHYVGLGLGRQGADEEVIWLGLKVLLCLH